MHTSWVPPIYRCLGKPAVQHLERSRDGGGKSPVPRVAGLGCSLSRVKRVSSPCPPAISLSGLDSSAAHVPGRARPMALGVSPGSGSCLGLHCPLPPCSLHACMASARVLPRMFCANDGCTWAPTASVQGVGSDSYAASVWVVCPQRLQCGQLALALRLLTPPHCIVPFALPPGAPPGSSCL